MKKHFVVLIVFVVCLLAANKSVNADAWYSEVHKTGVSNVTSAGVITTYTGFEVYAKSTSGKITVEFQFRKYPSDSYQTFPAWSATLKEGKEVSDNIYHHDGTYYRLKLRGWGKGWGYIKVREHY